MEIKHIEPFIEATANMFLDMLGMEAEYQTPYILDKKEKHGWDISGIIGIGGDSKGVVVISFESSLAKAITGTLTGNSNPENEDVIDAVGELVNIIAGNAKKGLEQYHLNISLPSIVSGNNHEISWTSVTPIVGIPFKVPQGGFQLSVGLENIIGEK